MASQQISILASQQGSGTVTSQSTTPGSNVAHVRPLQIQPSTEPDSEQSGANDRAIKDPGIAFGNIINIAPLEDECQIYKTVTVNINGVKKDVKVPLARTGSDNKQQDHVEEANKETPRDPSPPSTVTSQNPVGNDTLPTGTGQVAISTPSGTASHIKIVYPNNLRCTPATSASAAANNSAVMPILPQLLGLSSVDSSATSTTVVTSHSVTDSTSANVNLMTGHLAKPHTVTFQKANTGNHMYMIQTSPNQAKPQPNTQLPGLKPVGNSAGGIPGFLGSDGKFYVQLDPANLPKNMTASLPTQGISKVAVAQVTGSNTAVSAKQATKTPKPSCSWSYLTLKEGQPPVSTSQTATSVMTTSSTTHVSTAVSSKSVSNSKGPDLSGIRIESTFSLSSATPALEQLGTQVETEGISQTKQANAAFTYILTNANNTTTTTPSVSTMNVVTNPIVNSQPATRTLGSNVAMRIVQAPNQAVAPTSQRQGVTAHTTALPSATTVSTRMPFPTAITQLTTHTTGTPTPVSTTGFTVGKTTSSAAPTRKKFLGVIDISDDESEPTEPVAKKPAIGIPNTAAPTNVNRSLSGSIQPIATPPSQLESLIRDIACGKYVLIANKTPPAVAPVAQAAPQTAPPKSQQTSYVRHPRNTARKSFGRFLRRSSSEEISAKSDEVLAKIKAAHPELKEVRIHVEKLDLNIRGKKTFNVHKLNAYLSSRRRMKQQRLVKQRRLMNAIQSREKSKRSNKSIIKDEPIKLEVDKDPPEEALNDADAKDESAKHDTAIDDDVLKPEVVSGPRKRANLNADKSTSKSEASTANQKRKKSDPKPVQSVPVSSEEVIVQPAVEQQKTKFLLIRTSNANYLMPVQPGVSPMSVAQQISSKTAANVTVVSSASLTPVPSPVVYQPSVQKSKTLRTTDVLQRPMATPSIMPKLAIKNEPGTTPLKALQSGSLQSTPLLQSLMLEATRAEQASGVSNVSELRMPVSSGIVLSDGRGSPPGCRPIAPASVGSPPSVGRSLLITGATTPTRLSPGTETQLIAPTNDTTNTKCAASSFRKSPEKETTASVSTDAAPKDNPGDRIKRLREMLKQQEAAVELTREQREKTRKFMETMDD